MQIIPVIDLLNGVVVHAKRGERQHYQPIQSLLTSASNPLDIVAALLTVYPFQQLYIADLNAIQQQNDNFHHIRAISQQFPQLKLWIDAGINKKVQQVMLHSNVILGSENFSDVESYLSFKKPFHDNFVLSLDFMLNGFQGPAELLSNIEYWPQEVIVMSLANVGTSLGVNDKILNKIIQLACGKNVYAAGGVSGLEDLTMLKNMGAHGALIATALHRKQLTFDQLEVLCQ